MMAFEPTDRDSDATDGLAAGHRIGRFVLQALLHRGEASQLWRVVDATRDDDPPSHVLKIARRAPDASVRVEVEHHLLSLLRGPHVPEVVDHGEFHGQSYAVLEHLDGPSLQSRLRTQPLQAAQVIDLALQLACALHHLHRQGALHLDLQPRHIMFRATGELVLLSWGLARHEQQPDLHEHALDLDNGAYLSPEQIQWQRHDLRSDLFGWAVLVYESLTGQRPFGTPRTPQQLRQRLEMLPLPPRALRADCPDWLQEAILRNLEADPAQRHPNAAHLALELRHPDPRRLTERAHWTEARRPVRDGNWWWRKAQAACLPWRFSQLAQPPAEPLPCVPLSEQLQRHPIVMVVIDLRLDASSQAALRRQVEWILTGAPCAHLACVGLLHEATAPDRLALPPCARKRPTRWRKSVST
jgi:serine/threonine protein kinase